MPDKDKKTTAQAASGLTLSARFNQLMDSDSGDEGMSVPDALRIAAAVDVAPPSSLQSYAPRHHVAQHTSNASVQSHVVEDSSKHVPSFRPHTPVSTRPLHEYERSAVPKADVLPSFQRTSPSRGIDASPSRSEPLPQREKLHLESSVNLAPAPSSQVPNHGRPVVSFFDRLKDLI